MSTNFICSVHISLFFSELHVIFFTKRKNNSFRFLSLFILFLKESFVVFVLLKFYLKFILTFYRLKETAVFLSCIIT
jgi:hypothetical protein